MTSRTSAVYAIGMLLTWVALFTFSEQWLPATLLAYGPRWVVLLPLLLLVPAALLFARISLITLALGAAIALVPVMGLRVAIPSAGFSAPRAVPVAAGVDRIRVLSLNAQGGAIVKTRIDALIERYSPNIVAIQECSDDLMAVLRQKSGWYTAQYAGLCTASRWPIEFTDSMPRAAFQRVSALGYGGTGIVVRYGIAHPTRAFQFVNLHLETARKGLESLVGGQGFIPDDATGLLPDDEARPLEDRVALNARIRESESERASVWSARKMDEVPVIISGDFNMPVESSIYRQYWSALTNAFDVKGLGFGFTKHEGALLRLRIDHVLSAPKWFHVRGAWVGMDVGSDHRPMVADLEARWERK